MMKIRLICLMMALGALAPSLSLAAGPDALIQKAYPAAQIETVHSDTKQRDWVYRITPESGTPFFSAYGRARSRSGYYYILLAATADGHVLSVELPNYPHSHGRKAASASFLKQYENREETRYGQEIHGVTGATSTAKSTADKVRLLIKLIKKQSS